MAKEAFLIYTSFYKPISKLSDKQLGRLFRAVFRYNLGEVFDVEEDIEMAFEFFKNQFEIDESKYQSKVMRDIENGRKGGNPNFRKGQSNPYYRQGGNGNSPEGGKEITQDNIRLSDITQDNRGLSEITKDNPALPKITQDKAINDNDNVNVNVLKENAYGVKETPESALSPEGDCDLHENPETEEKCEACALEAENLQKKENSGGAAQNTGCGGVSPGGTVKPPSEARKSRSIEENVRICQESASWLEAVAMQNGMAVEGIKAELAKFPEHLTAYGSDEPKTLQDFKSHFNNYLKKKRNADDSAKARGARKGTGEAAAGGVGSGAERPRPKPLF